MLKKIKIFTSVVTSAVVVGLSASSVLADWKATYPWAVKGVNFCMSRGMIEGDESGDLLLGSYLTRAQMAKMIVKGLGLSGDGTVRYNDVAKNIWYYDYVSAIEDYIKKQTASFKGDEYVTREEFISTLMLCCGLNDNSVRNSGLLSYNFSDASEIDADYKKLVTVAVERAYIQGSDNMIRPKEKLTRAEVSTVLQRVIQARSGEITLTWEDLGVKQSNTEIIGKARVTVAQAQAWAKSKNAHQRFIDIAPVYWKYGELFGIRPEILYAQAAKETGYGKYTGAVKPEMNNWAGIKTKSATGDKTEDHETFATPDDGVRAHFNHMAAYIGLAPVGTVHDRYYVVKSISWAGTVKNVEALGGRWCPDLYYGYSILHDCLEQMEKF